MWVWVRSVVLLLWVCVCVTESVCYSDVLMCYCYLFADYVTCYLLCYIIMIVTCFYVALMDMFPPCDYICWVT